MRRLEAIGNVGSIDVLCTDKTGTLTKGIVDLSAAVNAEGGKCEEARRLALLNAELQTGIDSPLDAAIVGDARKRRLAPATAVQACGYGGTRWTRRVSPAASFLRYPLRLITHRKARRIRSWRKPG